MKISKFYLLLVLLVFLLYFVLFSINDLFELGIYGLHDGGSLKPLMLTSIVSAVLILSIYLYRNFPSRKK